MTSSTNDGPWAISIGEAIAGKRLNADLDDLVDPSARTFLVNHLILDLLTLKRNSPIDLCTKRGIPRSVYSQVMEFVNRRHPAYPWPTYDAIQEYSSASLFYKRLNEKRSMGVTNLLEALKRRDNPSLVKMAGYSAADVTALAKELSEDAWAILRPEVVNMRNVLGALRPFLPKEE
jgi:hypothetical protein